MGDCPALGARGGVERLDAAVGAVAALAKAGRDQRAARVAADCIQANGSVDDPWLWAKNKALARKVTDESIVLLKNEGGLLPLGKGGKSIAVIGPNAAEAVIEGGGSSKVPPLYRVSPLEALQKQAGSQVKIEYALGSDNVDEPFTIPVSQLTGTRSPRARG